MSETLRTYHRQNLEVVLLERAAEIVATRGVEALSLRELGRVAGVSRAAPYHYFDDKASLLARLGETGFQRMGRRIDEAVQAQAMPMEQLRAALAAYVRFAEEERHFFRLMFADVLDRGLEAQVGGEGADLRFSSQPAAAAFRTFLQGIISLQDAGVLRAGDPWMLLHVFWSYTHGVAVLAAGRHLKLREVDAVFHEGISALLRNYSTTSDSRPR